MILMGKDRYILTKNKKKSSIYLCPSVSFERIPVLYDKKNGRLFGIPAKLT